MALHKNPEQLRFKSMNSVKRVALFLFCNLTGLATAIGGAYAILLYDFIDVQSLAISANGVQTVFFGMPLMVWITCALFSFSIFFVSKKWRPFFYLAPIIAPALFLSYAFIAYL